MSVFYSDFIYTTRKLFIMEPKSTLNVKVITCKGNTILNDQITALIKDRCVDMEFGHFKDGETSLQVK